MPKYEFNLQDYWRIIRKRRWVIASIFIIILVPTIFYTKIQSVKFQAESQIAITERKTGSDWLKEIFYYTPGDPMKSYAEAILSQGVITRASGTIASINLGLISYNSIGTERFSDEKTRIPEALKVKFAAERNKAASSLKNSISAKIIEGTNKIRIIAASGTPESARDYANATAYGFEDYNLAEKTKEARKVYDYISTQLKETEKQLESSHQSLQKLREKYEISDIASTAYNRIEDLKKEKDELLKKYTPKHPDIVNIERQIQSLRKELSSYSNDEVDFARLNRDIGVYTTQYNNLKAALSNAAIEAEKSPDVAVANEATIGYPISGKKGLNIIAGIILGLVLGISLAFVMESLDTSLGTIEEIETLLKLPVLGVIPYLSKEKESKTRLFLNFLGKPKENLKSKTEMLRSQLIINFSTFAPIVEAYRILRTSIVKNGSAANQGKIIIITSTGPEEGKTITSMNLALMMAQKGEKVLLVDTDMRKSLIHKVLGINKEPGLSDLLLGTHTIDKTIRDITDTLTGEISYDIITKTPGIDNLNIITAGSNVPHPAELISNDSLNSLLKELRARYDYIILDSAPVLPVTDVLILGQKVNSVLLVYKAGRTAKSALIRTVDQLKNANINVKGIVLNHISPEIDISPSYYYHYYRNYSYADKKD